jgi:hypothetical protein
MFRSLGLRTAARSVAAPAARRNFATKTEAEIHAMRPDGKVPSASFEIISSLILGTAAGGIWWLYAQSEYRKTDAWNEKLKAMREARDN